MQLRPALLLIALASVSLTGCEIVQPSPQVVSAAPVQATAVVPTQPSPSAIPGQPSPLPQQPTDQRVALAQYLVQTKAKWYTTSWCTTCKHQQREFGQQAMSVLNQSGVIIDCEEQKDLCVNAGVHSYPTWELKGQQYNRGFPLNELAQLAGFPGQIPSDERRM